MNRNRRRLANAKTLCCPGARLVLAGLCLFATLGAATDLSAVRSAAEAGDAQAQYEFGKARQQSFDDAEAMKWWRRAAEQGHLEAHVALSVAYFQGRGVPRDESEGLAWLKKAADEGHAPAQYFLGGGYQSGTLTLPEDHFFAVHWFKEAAIQGHTEAQEMLASYPELASYLDDPKALFHIGARYVSSLAGDDDGVNEDKLAQLEVINGADGSEESAFWWGKAAEMGYVEAQVALGQYLIGRGDLDGIAWLGKAADAGYAAAQYMMSVWYWTDADLDRGVAYLRLAAEQGHAEAQCKLGLAYWVGKGVRRDRVQSYAWFNLGSRGGLTKGDCSNDLLDVAEGVFSTEEVAEAQALSRELEQRIASRERS